MEKRYNYDIIKDYLNGLTDQATIVEISELIRTDEVARTIAEGILRLEKEFKGDEAAIESYLNNFEQKQLKLIRRHLGPPRITGKVWFRVAASILLLISVAVVVRLLVIIPDPDTLVNTELAQPYPVSNLVRSEGDSSAKAMGYQAYMRGEFENATRYFEQVPETEGDVASVMFYNALSYLYAENYGNAQQLLTAAIIANSRYAQQAQWYLALAFLKSNKKDKATEILKSISDEDGHYKRDIAGKLLKGLE
jgi:hypothetical protein